MKISKKDVLWNYAATFLKIGSSVLLLPLILKFLDSQTIGVWTIFMSFTALINILDFGFQPSFSRNITYVFSGATQLKSRGFYKVENGAELDLSLLKGLIQSMRWFYLRASLLLFFILGTIGSFYINSITSSYKGNLYDVWTSWVLFCIISSYSLYTLYYDSLLIGSGKVKIMKQITIVANLCYLIVASILVVYNFGLVSIVFASLISIAISRILSYKAFFSNDIVSRLKDIKATPSKEIIKIISPNSIKIGITSLGGFISKRSSVIIGAMFLDLDTIASYGISLQVVTIIGTLASIYSLTYQPKIDHYRIKGNSDKIKRIYINGIIVLASTFIIAGFLLLNFGNEILILINSTTMFIDNKIMFVLLILVFLESNLNISGNIILSENDVPFFKASILNGIATVLAIYFGFLYLNIGLLTIVLMPLLVLMLYNGWRWPYKVLMDLQVLKK